MSFQLVWNLSSSNMVIKRETIRRIPNKSEMTREGIKKDFCLGESPKVTARGEGL